MARNRENRPELDYDLLVERHERFRSRHPQKKPGRPSDSVAPQAGTAPAQAQPAAEAANVQAPAQEAEVQATATAQAVNAAAEAHAQDVDFAAVVDAVAQDIPASAAEEAAEPADAPDDYDAMTVTTDKESLVLPKKEFLLLYKLAASPGRIFTKQQLKIGRASCRERV